MQAEFGTANLFISYNMIQRKIVALLGAVLASLCLKAGIPASDKLPNIIIIYTDDQRFDALGTNGNEVIQTPHLDKLGRKGLVFNNAHVVFSLCSPSRAALLTGRYGSANGVLELGSGLNTGEKTMAQLLKLVGYQTAMSGKWHLRQTPKQLGFDFSVYFQSNGTYYQRLIHDEGKSIKPEEHCDFYCADRSVDFLRESAELEAPFFLYHNTQLPHMNGKLEWDVKTETKAKYRVEDMPIAENRLDDLSFKPGYLKEVRNLTQAAKYGYPEKQAIQQHSLDYYSVTTEMDDALGKIFTTLDELELWQNTYVIYMSDNGWMLGEHGFTSKVLPYEASTHVPLVVAGSSVKKGISNALVSNIDILPTVLELAEVAVPDNVHGRSLVPVLQDPQVQIRESLVYEGLGGYGGAKPNLSVFRNDFRYIQTYADANLDKVIFEELYDIRNDPWEKNNLMRKTGFESNLIFYKKELTEHKSMIGRENSGPK